MSSNPQSMHVDLAATVAAYADRSRALGRVRSLRDTDSGFDAAGWRQAGELGWTGMLVPDRLGGAGMGLDEAVALAREVGRRLLPEPVLPGAVLAASLLLRSASPVAARVLAGLVAGETFPAVAWQETSGELEPTAGGTLVRDGTLSGRKVFVAFGRAAAGFLVSARSATGLGVYWVGAGAPGIGYRSQRRADGSEHGTLELDAVAVTAADILIEPALGESALGDALDATRLALAAELLGVGERALEITLEYLRTRTQFGKPIGSFQALQHRCVDLFVRKELGSAALGAALAEWPCAERIRRSALASRVKARCADAALEIGREAVQMHGAMGFTDECEVGLYLKRALVGAAWLGNAQAHRRRYARIALRGDTGVDGSEAA